MKVGQMRRRGRCPTKRQSALMRMEGVDIGGLTIVLTSKVGKDVIVIIVVLSGGCVVAATMTVEPVVVVVTVVVVCGCTD